MVGLPCVDVTGPELVTEELTVFNSVCSSSYLMGLSWQNVVGAALFGSLMVLLFFYLTAVLFRNDKTIAWVKMEMYELISTLLIILILIPIVQGFCSFDVGSILSTSQVQAMDVSGLTTSTNMYTASASYLRSISDRITKWMCLDMVGAIIADMGQKTTFKVAF